MTKTVADRIRTLREAKGWSQEELAKNAKIRQSFIGALEAGAQQSSGYLPEIAQALGVDAFWLKTGAKALIAGDRKIDEVVELMKTMGPEGRAIVLDKARDVAKEYPAAKQTAA